MDVIDDRARAWRIETIIGIGATEKGLTKALRGEHSVLGIAFDLAASNTDAAHHADEITVRVARIFLNLMHDAEAGTGIGFFGSERQTNAFVRHAADDFIRARTRGRVPAEGAIEESLGLRRHAIPVNRRTKDDAMRR